MEDRRTRWEKPENMVYVAVWDTREMEEVRLTGRSLPRLIPTSRPNEIGYSSEIVSPASTFVAGPKARDEPPRVLLDTCMHP